MTIPLSTFTVQTKNLVPDIPAEELAAINLQQLILEAVRVYSHDLPEKVTVDVSGTGSRYYTIGTLLTRWIDEFSNVLGIEYPARPIADNATPVPLEPSDWNDDYRDGNNVQILHLPNHSPAATEKMRIRYTTLYQWLASSITQTVALDAHGFSEDNTIYQDAAGAWVAANSLIATHIVTDVADLDTFTAAELASDIPPAHFFAVCHKAACLACQAIAAKYSRTSDSTISADSVAHTSRSEQFAARAVEFCRLYAAGVGLGSGDKGSKAAPGTAEFVDWDTTPGWPGNRRFIFHGGDWR